jgi:rfaE bifunctional protein nucleotidyltransferase chain/domain
MKVFVNGTFDILHPGHIELLNTARGYGDYLLVAIDSDRRVSELKGASRPVNPQDTRRIILANLKAVDEVKLFDTDRELINIIRSYAPDIMIVGSDYRDKRVIGSEYAGKLIFFERIDEYSTTNTIQNIGNRRPV